MADEVQQRIEAYLGKLRGHLRGVNDAEVREIVEELRGHVVEKAGEGGEITVAGVEAALARLGSPEELASQYLTDNLLARAEISRSPFQILKSLFRLASLSVAGFFLLLGSLVGYISGAVFMLVAVAKIFHPRTAGLWRIPSGSDDYEISFRLGFGSIPAGGQDVLGWWIVPIGWVAGAALVIFTTLIAIWFVGQYRKSLGLVRGSRK